MNWCSLYVCIYCFDFGAIVHGLSHGAMYDSSDVLVLQAIDDADSHFVLRDMPEEYAGENGFKIVWRCKTK